jgi:hypothetical protein
VEVCGGACSATVEAGERELRKPKPLPILCLFSLLNSTTHTETVPPPTGKRERERERESQRQSQRQSQSQSQRDRETEIRESQRSERATLIPPTFLVWLFPTQAPLAGLAGLLWFAMAFNEINEILWYVHV